MPRPGPSRATTIDGRRIDFRAHMLAMHPAMPPRHLATLEHAYMAGAAAMFELLTSHATTLSDDEATRYLSTVDDALKRYIFDHFPTSGIAL